jgi:hypothetical protein
MPSPVPAGAIMELIMEGRLFGQQIMTVLHYKLSDGPALPDQVAATNDFIVAAAAGGLVISKWVDCLSEQVVDITPRAQIIHPVRYAYQTNALFIAEGGVAQPSLPSNSAVAISRRTFDTGPHEHGTIHMPGVPSTFVVDGSVNLVGQPVYGSFADEMKLAITVGFDRDWDPVIFNRSAPETSKTIQDTSLKFPIRTMHRRTVGLGS